MQLEGAGGDQHSDRRAHQPRFAPFGPDIAKEPGGGQGEDADRAEEFGRLDPDVDATFEHARIDGLKQHGHDRRGSAGPCRKAPVFPAERRAPRGSSARSRESEGTSSHYNVSAGCAAPEGEPQREVQQQAEGAEQEGQRQAGQDQQRRNAALEAVSNDPAADEQVEGEIVEPARRQRAIAGEQGADLGDRTKAAALGFARSRSRSAGHRR